LNTLLFARNQQAVKKNTRLQAKTVMAVLRFGSRSPAASKHASLLDPRTPAPALLNSLPRQSFEGGIIPADFPNISKIKGYSIIAISKFHCGAPQMVINIARL